MGRKLDVISILTKSIPLRREFHSANKDIKETHEEWLNRVKELAEPCKFGKNYNLFVLDKFVTGLEAEDIDFLCSKAECLTLENSLQIIKEREAVKTEIKHETIVPEDTEYLEEPISEIFVECDGDIPTEEYFDDSDDSDESFGDDSKDSDFEEPVPKRGKSTKKEPKTKRKTKKELKAENDQKQENNETNADDDPNAPKKRRKYKKRAVKEKQIFECEICHYKVNHECHLRRHKLIHLNEKSFICHICGKGFNLSINLNAHLRRHAGYKPHVCEVCNASFNDKKRHMIHLRTHTGERPYACNVCDKRFADQYYMKVHMRLHTGERPFKCDMCQKTFSQSSSLSVHKKKNCLLNPGSMHSLIL